MSYGDGNLRYVKKIPLPNRELSALLLSEGWQKIKEPSNLFWAIIYSAPVVIVNSLIAYFVLKPFYDPLRERILTQTINIQINWVNLIIAIIAFLLLFPVHELLHAVFIPRFIKSDKTYWGFSIYSFFVGGSEKMTKANFIVISLAPFVIISLILPLVFGYLGLMNGLIFWVGMFNAVGSCVDILNLILILFQVPSGSFIVNNGFETYYH